jgi:hypothetical protein
MAATFYSSQTHEQPRSQEPGANSQGEHDETDRLSSEEDG